jgi:hypothetical protein
MTRDRDDRVARNEVAGPGTDTPERLDFDLGACPSCVERVVGTSNPNPIAC